MSSTTSSSPQQQQQAAAIELQEAITDRLRVILGEEGVEILTEYVWHMLVSPKRNPVHIVQELREFLAGETESFVEWLLQKVVPQVDCRVLGIAKKEKSPPVSRVADSDDRREEERHAKNSKRQQQLPTPAPIKGERHGPEADAAQRKDRAEGQKESAGSRRGRESEHQRREGRRDESARRAAHKEPRVGRLLNIAVQQATSDVRGSGARQSDATMTDDDQVAAPAPPSPAAAAPILPSRRIIAHDGLTSLPAHPYAPPPFYGNLSGPPHPANFVTAAPGAAPSLLNPLQLQHAAANLAGLALSAAAATTAPPRFSSQKKIKKRCAKWPECEFGNNCNFVHPSEMCYNWPHCPFGSHCFYIHPEVACKFGMNCHNAVCNYTHPEGWDPTRNMARQTMHSTFFANKSLQCAPVNSRPTGPERGGGVPDTTEQGHETVVDKGNVHMASNEP